MTCHHVELSQSIIDGLNTQSTRSNACPECLVLSRTWEQYFSSVFESNLPHLTFHAWLQPNYDVFPRVWRAFKISRSSIEQLWPLFALYNLPLSPFMRQRLRCIDLKEDDFGFSVYIFRYPLLSRCAQTLVWSEAMQSSAELSVMWKKLFPLSHEISSLLSCRRYLLFLS